METMSKKLPVNLADMDRAFFETLDPAALVELTCRLHALAIEQAERLAQNSTNSSRPPSSDGPFGPPGGGTGLASGSRTQPGSPQVAPSSLPTTPSGRKPGKQRGAKGVWRSAPLEAEGTRNHFPAACAICGTVVELWDPNHSAHFVLDLEPVGGGIRIACLRHIHHATQCACGTAAWHGRADTGALARSVAERGVSAALVTFIAALSVRYHISRTRIPWPDGSG